MNRLRIGVIATLLMSSGTAIMFAIWQFHHAPFVIPAKAGMTYAEKLIIGLHIILYVLLEVV